MPDFSKLYQKPPGAAKRPPTLPSGDYPGIIRTYEVSESREKKTPCVRYFITLSDWAVNAPQSWSEVDEEGKKWDYTQSEVNLSTRPQRFEFWFPTDDNTGEVSEGQLFRFDQFLRSFDGMDPSQYSSYEELFPWPVGRRVVVTIMQQLNAQTNRIFAQTQRIIGQS
jgi:hypothetical protein